MPYIVGVLNFACEISAFFWTSGFWGYLAWSVLDLFVVFFGAWFLNSNLKRACYLGSIALCTVVFFLISTQSSYFFVIIAFMIDLCMAILYLVEFNKISPKLRITIATTRLIGSLFSAFVFEEYVVSGIMALITFVINLIYLYCCIKKKCRLSADVKLAIDK